MIIQLRYSGETYYYVQLLYQPVSNLESKLLTIFLKKIQCSVGSVVLYNMIMKKIIRRLVGIFNGSTLISKFEGFISLTNTADAVLM